MSSRCLSEAHVLCLPPLSFSVIVKNKEKEKGVGQFLYYFLWEAGVLRHIKI